MLFLILGLLGTVPAAAFDSYTLALSWEPAFCKAKPSASECARANPDLPLTLHGLWPDQVDYCGVDSETAAIDRASTWCRLPEPSLSGATRSALDATMPGAASCLDRHEWVKHGTCSELAADGYFALAAALVQAVAETHFGRYLRAHAGETVDAENALAAFEEDFGAGSRGKIALRCSTVGGKPTLLEVRVRLSARLRTAAEMGSMLLSAGRRGGCPTSFRLDSGRP